MRRGLIAGFFIDFIVLLALPEFLGRWRDLFFFPAVTAALGALLSLFALPRARRSRHVHDGGASSVRVARGGRRPPREGFMLIGSIALALILFLARTPARSWTVAPRALIYGLDGATPNLLVPLMADGRLPTFSRITREGAYGELMSFEPSVSPILWTSIATGVMPEKHGIHSFYSTRDQLRAKRIWEVLQERQHPVGIFRWYVTWPPPPTKGFLIPDFLGRDARSEPPEYAFVNGIRNQQKTVGFRLSDVPRYAWHYLRAGVRLQSCLANLSELTSARLVQRDAILTHVAMRRAELRMNSDVYRHLLRKYQPYFSVFYDNGTDTFGHYYWRFYEPEGFPGTTPEEARRYGSIMPDYYQLLDEELATLLDHLSPETTLLICSDHGHQADLEAGQLRVYPRIETILEDLGMEKDYYGLFLGGHIFVESIKTDRTEVAAAITHAAETLRAVRVVENGDPVFVIERPDSARLTVRFAPTTDAETQHMQVGDRVIPEKNWALEKPGGSGRHRPEGILLMHGPAIVPGHVVRDARLVDVTPTLFYLMDQPLSREFDGRVLEAAIRPEYRSQTPVAWVDSYGPVESSGADLAIDAETREKLRALGYLQ